MTMFLAPYTSIADIDGSPLDAGFVFIGEQGKNPESSPVPVFWDADFTIPAAQPIRTRNGYPVRNGSPAKIYLREPMHSISVKDRNGSTIFVDVSCASLVSTLLVRPSGATVEQTFKDIDQKINTKADQTYVEEQLDLKANQDTTYSKTEVDSALDQKANQSTTYTKSEVDSVVAPLTGGHKGYTTLALAQAAQGTLPINTIVEVTNDPTASNNGTYQWNGTTLTKSAYDPLTQAKADATTKANAAEANAKTFFTQNGFARLVLASSGSIDYNSTSKVLTFSGTIHIVTNGGTATLTTPQSLTLSSTTPYRIEYSPSNGLLYAVSYTSAKADGRIVLGSATASTAVFKADGFNYTVDGVAVYQSHAGELVNSVASRINFNDTDKKLVINAAVRVKSPVYSAAVSSSGNVEVAYPSSGTYKLVFNLTTKTFSFSSITASNPQSVIELATVVFSTNAVTSVTGISNYSINGQAPQSALAQQNFTARLAASDPSSINVSFKNKKISIASGKARLAYEKGTLLIPATEIPFLDIPGDYWQKVIFNKESSTFYCKQFNTALVDNEFVFALIQPYTRSVIGIPDYYLEGQPVKSNPKDAQFISAYGDLKPNYVQPVLPEFATFLAANDKNFNAIYALYDALLSAYPTYITKKNIGVDSAGNTMYSYQFTTAEVSDTASGTKKPKFLIFSGMHGWETAGVMNTYHAMKEICERHAEDAHLEALKHGINFIVVPVCNPSGYALGTRQNINGVDIARNFPTNWIYEPDTQSTTYGGEAPADQIETRNLIAVMDEHKDALCFASHHNFSTSSDFMWVSARSQALVSSVKQLIIGQTLHAKKTYTFMPQTDDYHLGYVSYTPVGGGMESTHAQEYGMYAATVEIGRVIPWQPSMPLYSSEFATMACQFFVNYILLAVDNAVKFHNSRVRYYENL